MNKHIQNTWNKFIHHDSHPFAKYHTLLSLTILKYLAGSMVFELNDIMQVIFSRFSRDLHKFSVMDIIMRRMYCKRLVKEEIIICFLNEYQLFIDLATRKNLYALGKSAPTEHNIEEVIQDVRIAIYNNLEMLNGKDRVQLRAYLWKLIRFKCIDFLRRKSRKNHENLDSIALSDHPTSLMPLPRGDDEVLLAMLTTSQRIALTLSIEGYNYQEIADKMKRSVSAIKNLILRARKTIAEAMSIDRYKRKQVS